MLQIANGIDVLHSNEITYYSLHPSNILLDDNLKPILSNYGLMRYIYNDNYFNGYDSPELISSKDNFINIPISSDIWSFGCLLYYIFTHKHVFNNIKQLHDYIEGKYIPELPNNIPGNYKRIFWSSLILNPKDRINIKEIIDRLNEPTQDNGILNYIYNESPITKNKLDLRSIILKLDEIINNNDKIYIINDFINFKYIKELYFDSIFYIYLDIVLIDDDILNISHNFKQLPLTIISFTCIFFNIRYIDITIWF